VRQFLHKRRHVPVPRLTNADYLIQREFLIDAWNHFRGVFSYFSYNEQMELHAYFAPYKELSANEATTHRKQVTHDHPSLPQRAGKIYARFYEQVKVHQARLTQAPTAAAAKPQGRITKQNIRVRGIARPESDLHKLALALLETARQMQAEEQETAA
jgi:hypothetical protein